MDFKATPGKRQASSLVETGQKIVINPSIWVVHFEQETRNGWALEVGCIGLIKLSCAPACVFSFLKYLFVYLAVLGVSFSL